MTFDQLLATAQLLLVVLNIILVPVAFAGVRWVISVERQLAVIAVKLDAGMAERVEP